MAVAKSWLRVGAALVLLAGLLGLGMGCHHAANTTNSQNVYGTVTYTRVPLNIGTDGLPTGLQNDPNQYQVVPARGVRVRVFQAKGQQDVYGNLVYAWEQAGTAVTDINGYYHVGGLTVNLTTFVELESISSTSGTVVLVGDPAGIDSLIPEPARPIYAMRKAVDGSTSTTNPTYGTPLYSDAIVNYAVGLSDPWLLTPQGWNNPSTGPFTYPPTLPVGSRVLAILDSIYKFAYEHGNPTPGQSLDLHYNPNVRHARGSFVEYDQSVYPLSFDGSVFHYFGSLAGTITVNNILYPDDAYYEGIIWQLLGRNHLFAQHGTVLYPTGTSQTHLAPNLAVLEGLADAMAAGMLTSPFVPDASNPARYPPRDISAAASLPLDQQSAFSAPTISALAWNMLLITNSVTPPGTQAQWGLMIPGYLNRLYALARPFAAVGKFDVADDVTSIYEQVALMQNPQSGSDALNLDLYFPDTTLTPLMAQFNLPWTNVLSLPQYTVSWGMDPNSLVSQIPTFTLSMANAELVRGVYPNNSEKEVYFSTFTASTDHAYNLSVTTVPPLPKGALIEVTVDPALPVSAGVYIYGGSNPTTNQVTVAGNYADLTNPKWHYLQIRLVSPAILQPDLAVTVHMDIVNPSNPNVSLNSSGS